LYVAAALCARTADGAITTTANTKARMEKWILTFTFLIVELHSVK
jgi:hypothetical protein